MAQARLRHPFADAALFEEVFFQAADLLIEDVVGLVDQADGDVRHHFAGTRLAEGTIGLIGPMGLIGEAADVERFLGVFRPEPVPTHPEKILIVLEEFFEAGARDVCQLRLGSFDVPDALLASTIFCFVDRAAWTTWSMVRSPRLKNRSQK